MWSALFSIIGFIPGLAQKFLDWQVQKSNILLEGFRVGATVDVEAYKAYLQSTVEINRMKLAQQTWWGARAIILVAGVPASCHFAAIMLDSFPFPYLGWDTFWFAVRTHEVGSWGIPKPPAPYDEYQWAIIQSFFLVVPAMPLVSAVSTWLATKK